MTLTYFGVKSQVYVLNQSHTTQVLVNLFRATCFGRNCEPLSGLI